jgi:uncharacterized protein with von Willebrand factor type A (vWA) domain
LLGRSDGELQIFEWSFTMIKPTPNPPAPDDVSPYQSPTSKTLHEAADRALDHYLNPLKTPTVRKPSTMFVISPDIDTETLLAHACESLASASVMANDFAAFLEGSQRNTLLGIAQVIMLGELAVNRALDNLDPQQ